MVRTFATYIGPSLAMSIASFAARNQPTCRSSSQRLSSWSSTREPPKLSVLPFRPRWLLVLTRWLNRIAVVWCESLEIKSDAPGLGKAGTGVLSVDGKEVARNSMEHTTPIAFPEDESFDIGEDTRTGVAM